MGIESIDDIDKQLAAMSQSQSTQQTSAQPAMPQLQGGDSWFSGGNPTNAKIEFAGPNPDNVPIPSTPNGMIQTGSSGGHPEFKSPQAAAVMKAATSETPQDKHDSKLAEEQATNEPGIYSALNAIKLNVGEMKALQKTSGIGRWAGAVGEITGRLGTDPNIQGYKSLNMLIGRELAKIANPSGRVTDDAAQHFSDALPTQWNNEGEGMDKLTKAVDIALARRAGYFGKKYDPASPENMEIKKEILSSSASPSWKDILGQQQNQNTSPTNSGDFQSFVNDVQKKTGAKITIHG